MAKNLPSELREFYFPFNWDKEKLWALPVEPQQMAVADLLWHLDIPIWSRRKETMLFDLHPRHEKRVEACDLSYAIDLMESVGRLVILDGVHRLVKAVMEKRVAVMVRNIPRQFISEFIDEDTDLAPTC